MARRKRLVRFLWTVVVILVALGMIGYLALPFAFF